MPTVDELYQQGEQLKDQGKFEEAIATFQELLNQDETYTLAHLALAVVYGKVGQHEQAIQHAVRACELEPDDPFSFTALSVTYQRAFAGTNEPQYIHKAEEAMARSHLLQSRR